MANTDIYTIKDVAARTGISAYTLRFYDKEGLLTFVKRSPSGIRLFTDEDFEPLYTIQCLKRSGMPLKKIKKFMELYIEGNDTICARRKMFEEQRDNINAQIKDLQEMLKVIEYKCWYFEEAEKYGDAYFYKNIPAAKLSPKIKNFLKNVKEFHSES